MMRIQLSGPMMEPHDELEFEKAEKFLRSQGYTHIFNPTKITYDNPLYAGLPGNGFREISSNLSEAETVIFLPGWENARGSITELLLATLFGCTLYEYQDGKLKLLSVERNNVNRIIADLLKKQQNVYDNKLS